MAKNFKILAAPGTIAALMLLGGCGGGGGANSTPTPTPSPAPSPTPASPPVNYDTDEYKASSGPKYHDAITAYQNGASGAGITVGIVDTGIATGNTEFSGRISPYSQAFNGTGSIEDNDGHGTAVATVLAAARNNRKTMGMAWNATIMALRTDDPTDCDPTDGCSHPTSYITQAVNHAVARGAKVINISLGGDGSTPSLRTAVSNATGAGVIIVISSGNDGNAAPNGFASELAEPTISHGLVILATSNNSDGTHSGFTHGGSANGALGYENVTLSALGNEVRAQDNTGTESWWEGTSFSAPQVAGAIALLLQAFPNLTPQQVVDRLLNTARDAGASGPDALFGMGIMDLAAAFAPAGTTSLGDSKTALSLTTNGALSSAMGDAAGGTTTQAIAIDALGRAYSINLQPTLGTRPARTVLRPLTSNHVRNAMIGGNSFSGSINLTQPVAARFNRFGEMLSPAREQSLSGRAKLQLDKGTVAALGYRAHGQELADTIAGVESAGIFLAASDSTSETGFETLPHFAIATSHRLNGNLHVMVHAESGRQFDSSPERRNDPQDNPGYAQFSAGMHWKTKPARLSLSASLLDEPDSLLGARLAPFFGVTGSQTLFADARLSTALPGNVSLHLSLRRGWTEANRAARLATSAWSMDAVRTGLFGTQDRIGLRIAQPLRVTSGGVDAFLPIAHDYATGRSEWRTTRINLSPKGREIDTELHYGLPAGRGWLDINGYWQREPGNIAWAADDFGGAIRLRFGY